MTMTYAEACQKAATLHKQGMTYPKIEEILRNAGYVSDRTKKPVGALAVRHMATQHEKGEKKEKSKRSKEDAKDAKETKIVLSAPEPRRSSSAANLAGTSFEEIVSAIMSLDSGKVSAEVKMELVEAVTERRRMGLKK